MQTASAETVLGDFGGTTFAYGAITSTFFKKEGAYYVRTDGPDGTLHEYHVAYTLGVYPLQQYLIEFPGGRLQALGIAWDARPASDGGRRWFHLYPDENVDHRDVLHWTGPAQNWDFMCAECHSTNVRKNYTPGTDSYATTWSEIDVTQRVRPPEIYRSIEIRSECFFSKISPNCVLQSSAEEKQNNLKSSFSISAEHDSAFFGKREHGVFSVHPIKSKGIFQVIL